MTGTTFAAPPHRFEAGTPMIAEAVGLGAAIDYVTALGMDDDPRARARADRATRSTRCSAVAGLRIIGPSDRRRPRRHHLVHARRASTRTTSPSCSTSRASRSAPATTAPGRCACATASRPPPGRRSASTRRPDEIDALVAGRRQQGAGGCSAMSACSMDSMYQQIILDHYKHPQHRGLLDRLRRRGAPRQPDLRRRGDPAGRARRRRDRRARLGRRGLLDQPGVDVGDERAGGRRADRPTRCELQDEVPGADAVARHGRADRGRGRGARRRGRVRGRVEVPGAGQVRAAGLDGDEERGGRGRAATATKEEPHDTRPQPCRPATTIDEAMRDVVDPELGINVVDLGLVYDLRIDRADAAP